MIFNVQYQYTQEYRQTKKHKRVLKRNVCEEIELEVAEVTQEEFPLAFMVRWAYVDEGKKVKLPICISEIRVHNGILYKTVDHVMSVDLYEPMKAESLPCLFQTPNYGYLKPASDNFNEDSIVVGDNKNLAIEHLRNKSKMYLIYNGEIWLQCGEPVYHIHTLEYRGKRDLTWLSVTYRNDNPDNKYFNAFQLEEALQYARESAKEHGGELNISGFEEKLVGIDVVMPEMVRVEKHKDLFPARLTVNCTVEVTVPADSAEEASSIAVKKFRPQDLSKAKILDCHCTAAERNLKEPAPAEEKPVQQSEKDLLEDEYGELLEAMKAEGSALAFYLVENLTELSDEVTEEEYTAEYDRIMRVFNNTWEQYRRSISGNRKKYHELCKTSADDK